MNIYIDVSVKYSAGAYTARMHQCRASSTMDAETAVRRAAEKYLAGSSLVLIDMQPSGPDQYRARIGREEAK